MYIIFQAGNVVISNADKH